MALELLYEPCPYCSDGKLYNPHQERMVDCAHCNAKGWVIVNHICACGKPCTHLDGAGQEEQYLYCGDKTCLAMLKTDRREAEWEAKHPNMTYGSNNYGSSYFGQGRASQWHADADEDEGGYVWPGYGARLDG